MCTGSYVQLSRCVLLMQHCRCVYPYSLSVWSRRLNHTNPFSYASVFDPTKTNTNIRVHISVFESFSTVHTSYEKTIRFRSPWETDYRVHDVSVFENLRFRRFRPSTLIRNASVFESLHLGRRFRKEKILQEVLPA